MWITCVRCFFTGAVIFRLGRLFYGKYYSVVSGLKLPAHIALLSWLNERNWYEALLLKKYAAIRNDERVKVILVRDTGHYSR